MIYRLINPAVGGVIVRTIKSTYYKVSAKYFLTSKINGFTASAILIEYEI